MIITIDGYAASGKTSAAEKFAGAIGFPILMTGWMYRAVGLKFQELNIPIETPMHWEADLRQSAISDFAFEMPPGRVFLNGADFTHRMQERGTGALASKVSLYREVREKLKTEQRRIVGARDMVCEGRDQGTAVFPAAELKFFFDADLAVRAERRVQQLRKNDEPCEYAEVLRKLADRDAQDTGRDYDPLFPADGCLRIDTTTIVPETVQKMMMDEYRKIRGVR